MTAQSTSKLAFNDIQPKLGRLQERVYEYILKHGPVPNKRLSQLTGLAINVVTPRVGELRGYGLVTQAYKAKYEGKTVIYWSATGTSVTDTFTEFKQILFDKPAQPNLWGGQNG